MENLKQGMVSIFLAQMLKDRHIHIKGSPDRFRDFIHVDDVVESFVRCLKNENSVGKSINIATGKQTKVSDVIQMLTSIFKDKVTVEYEGGTLGDIHGIYADVILMNNILGAWKKIELKEGISKMANSYINSSK